MTPLEINKAIAEIKGLDVLLSPKYPNGIYVQNKIGGTIPYLKTTNYAESIQDAWELFEEMHIGFSIMRDKEYNWCLFHNSIFAVASTAPMAIALAWLRWKDKPVDFKDIVTMS